MEVGLRPEIPTYSGGLGILAGDTLKSFADLSVPAVGVTLLYTKWYFHQEIDAEGNQIEGPVEWNPADFLTLLTDKVTVEIEGRTVMIQAWVCSICAGGLFSIESPDAKEVRTRFHLQAEKIPRKGPFLLQMPSVPFQSERWSLQRIWN
jgi:glucan phosphorylase